MNSSLAQRFEIWLKIERSWSLVFYSQNIEIWGAMEPQQGFKHFLHQRN
jgi:hypothetical protein